MARRALASLVAVAIASLLATASPAARADGPDRCGGLFDGDTYFIIDNAKRTACRIDGVIAANELPNFYPPRPSVVLAYTIKGQLFNFQVENGQARLIFPTPDDPPPMIVDVQINGELLDLDPAPFVDNGRTLVPMRPIFEALGASVQWSDTDRRVTGTRGADSVAS